MPTPDTNLGLPAHEKDEGRMATCMICRTEARNTGSHFECPRCGQFDVATGGWDPVEVPTQQVPISAWIRQQNAMEIIPYITLSTLRQVRNIPIPSLRDRANLLLAVLAKTYPRVNDGFVLSTLCDSPQLQAVTYSADHQELNDLFAILLSHDGFIDLRNSGSPPNRLTVKGLLAADELRTIKAISFQGFVAMSFAPCMVDAWTAGFEPAIRAAGYAPLRIDAKEYVGGISDEIISEIRKSRFVVADYTEHKNGVYFEAGFALGLGLAVIPSCRADEIGELHFDIKHLNTLAWTDPEDLAVKLHRRVTAVIGPGPTI